MPFSDSDLRALEPKGNRYKVSIGNGVYVEVYPNGGKYLLWKYHFPPGRNGQQRWYQIGPYGRSPAQWTIKKAKEEKERLDSLRKEGEDPRVNKKLSKIKRKSIMLSSKDYMSFNKVNQDSKDKVVAGFTEYRDITDCPANIFRDKETCYIILGHEIDQISFDLSASGKDRCKLLADKIQASLNKNYFVIFMGLGRLQGKCQLSISECMFAYFSQNYFTPTHYVIEKRSLDTVGDAFFSCELLDHIGFSQQVFVVTSDWHLKRSKIVFKKIFKSKCEL